MVLSSSTTPKNWIGASGAKYLATPTVPIACFSTSERGETIAASQTFQRETLSMTLYERTILPVASFYDLNIILLQLVDTVVFLKHRTQFAVFEPWSLRAVHGMK